MAIQFVQQAQASALAASTTIAAPAITPVTGDLLAWFAACTASSATTVALSDGGSGNVYRSVTNNHTGTIFLMCGFAAAVAGVATTITATFSQSVTGRAILVAEYSGLDTGNPYNPGEFSYNQQAAPGTGVNAITSGNILAAAATGTAILIGICNDSTANNAPSVGTLLIERGPIWNFGAGGNSTSFADQILNANGAYADVLTASVGGDTYNTLAMVLHANSPLPFNQTIFFNEDRTVRY